MDDLSKKRCIPCEGNVLPLTLPQISTYQPQVPLWQPAPDGRSISREFKFKDFKEAVAFVNEVADIAEFEGHHPDMNLHDYKKLLVMLSTHAIGGLSENDFILAAKIDRIG